MSDFDLILKFFYETDINLFLIYNLENDVLEAKIFACEDYKINDQIEKIYVVDLLFCGEDSLIEYMLDSKLAVEEVRYFKIIKKKIF